MRLPPRPGSRARTVVSLAAAAALAALLLSAGAAPASAHEGRRVGKYVLVVGFGDEPAYAGAKNSVQLLLSDASGKPVTNLAVDKLQVHGFYGAKVTPASPTIELPLEANFGDDWGTPGDYRSFFVPTAPGTYSFHLLGTINGQKVSQLFTSGPDSFGDVVDPAKTSFPASGDPSSGQLARRLDRELPRLSASVAVAQASSQAAEQRARDEAGQARLLGLGGMAFGLVGIVLAAVAAVAVRGARRRPPEPPTPAGTERPELGLRV